jgi:transglutaminase-like putative cysteine protease
MALLVTGSVRAAEVPAAPEDEFPALPGASERVAKNEDERVAGFVVLESEHRITGDLVWHRGTPGGEVIHRRRYRFLVLDFAGQEVLETYGYPNENLRSAARLAGRTVLPDGTVHPLDPATDLRRVALPAGGAGAPRMVPTVVFPRAEPGAILDLAWTESARRAPSLQFLVLQEPFPIRKARVRVEGQLQRGRTVVVPTPIIIGWSFRPGAYWVPFFAGPVPPRATATLDSEFNLDLELTDVPPMDGEPFQPGAHRTGYVLGLMPRKFDPRKKVGKRAWREHLAIFGVPGSVEPDKEARSLSRDLDPARSVVRLDDLGLQVIPDDLWSGWEFLEPLQDELKGLERDLRLHWVGEGRDRAAIESIAPADLQWAERARRLHRHARRQIRVDPRGRDHKKPADLLKEGRGTPRDLAFYLAGLLEGAGIRARLVRAQSRYRVPFHPIVGTNAAFDPAWLLEVGPPGATPLYLVPGDPSASLGSLPAAYAGGLAFSRPEEDGADWRLARLPADLWKNDATEIRMGVSYDPEAPELDLSIETTLRGTAAAPFREEVDPTGPGGPSAARASGQARKTLSQPGCGAGPGLGGPGLLLPASAPTMMRRSRWASTCGFPGARSS